MFTVISRNGFVEVLNQRTGEAQTISFHAWLGRTRSARARGEMWDAQVIAESVREAKDNELYHVVLETLITMAKVKGLDILDL